MAGGTSNNAPAGAKPASPSALARLRALPGWLFQSRLRGGLVVGAMLLSVIGGGFALTLAIPTSKKAVTVPTLPAALAALDAGDNALARQLAADMRKVGALSYEELGGPLFVLGTVTARDADERQSASEKQMLFALASRYLEEARGRGFPPQRNAEGLWQLGRALHHSGQLAKCVPILREALSSDAKWSGEIHQMLAGTYLQMSPPQLREALDHNRLFLAQSKLTEQDREAGALLAAQILWAQGDLPGCRAELSKIAATSPQHETALLWKVRLKIREGDVARFANDALNATARYREARESLGSLLQEEQQPTPATAKAQLLLGVCLERSGDAAGAAKQFERVRRMYFGQGESLAATLFEADLQRQAGALEDALTLYQRVLQEAGPRDSFQNEWLALAELETGLQAALDDFLARRDFTRALQLARALPPLIAPARALELQARVHLAWANELDRQAREGSNLDQSAAAEARGQHREAGAALEELAKLRITTRYYTDDLAASAEHFLEGHGYEQAARVYRQLLQQDVRAREPDALRGLGEALLSLGQTESALATLTTCCEAFPKHPATYRARLLVALALEEQGKLAEARRVLNENLYNFGLTPQSNEWQQSLFALGSVLYREGLELETKSRQAGVDDLDPLRRQAGLAILEQSHALFEEAIQILTEVTERYPTAPQAAEARYRIAESYRQRSKWPRKKLGTVTIETTRVSLNRQIQVELQAALDEYAGLIATLGSEQDTSSRSSVEQAILRNCYFGRADALFDLGSYEKAAQAYSAATNRYQHEPESLEAYVQIAACYRRLGRPGEARGTLEQARVVLKRLPADAEFTRTTRYNREEWSQLLIWLASL